MEYNKEKREIVIKKKANNLDKFALSFCGLLDRYVIVSGYVSIILGRSRATEDIDLLIPSLTEEEFERIWEKVHEKGFECVNTSKRKEAFSMLKEHAIRFFKNNPVPNIEFKTIKTDLDKYSYENKIKVVLKDGELFISPLELQIAYKLFLASDEIDEEFQPDKDIEDARHLYRLFKEKINKEELLVFIKKLNVEKRLRLLE